MGGSGEDKKKEKEEDEPGCCFFILGCGIGVHMKCVKMFILVPIFIQCV